jgi:hypothetical protein
MSAWTDFLDKVKAQNFGPDDSQIVSSLVHPARGFSKLGEFIQQSVQAASQAPMQGDNQALRDNAVVGANNLAGLMQTGAIPFAPRSAGGTLGTFVGPKSSGWNSEAAAQASKLLDEGANPAQFIKSQGTISGTTLTDDIKDLGINEYQAYRRLTGEAQSRATQDRMKMNMDERRNTYPLAGDKLSDIPLKDLINRYDTGIQSSVNNLPDTEFSKAHAVAQKNAALPVEQGGLGLPHDNTAMDRAAAQDWVVPGYHGTNSDIESFGNSQFQGLSTGAETSNGFDWFASHPDVSGKYAERAANKFGTTGQNVLPVLLKSPNLVRNTNRFESNYQGMKDTLKDAPKESVVAFENLAEPYPVSTHYAVGNAPSIRSRFAAFDPLKKDSANILASILGGTTLVSAMEKDKKRNKK